MLAGVEVLQERCLTMTSKDDVRREMNFVDVVQELDRFPDKKFRRPGWTACCHIKRLLWLLVDEQGVSARMAIPDLIATDWEEVTQCQLN